MILLLTGSSHIASWADALRIVRYAVVLLWLSVLLLGQIAVVWVRFVV
jgi:hypothetical protein